MLSIKGWDGTTIMGTYLSVEEAKAAGYSYIMASGKNSDMFYQFALRTLTYKNLIDFLNRKDLTVLQNVVKSDGKAVAYQLYVPKGGALLPK